MSNHQNKKKSNKQGQRTNITKTTTTTTTTTTTRRRRRRIQATSVPFSIMFKGNDASYSFIESNDC